MRFLLALALISGCKHDAPTTPTGGSGSADAPVKQTPYATRRDAACKKLGPKLTSCALEDAKAALAKGEIKQTDFDEATKPGILAKNTSEATEACMKIGTTHELRVIEVCLEQETACEPLGKCLEHMTEPGPAKPAAPTPDKPVAK